MGANMKSKSGNGRLACVTLALLALAASVISGRAEQLLQQQTQPAGPNVEASTIHKYACNGQEERKNQVYIYEYPARARYRVIVPPNWSAMIGGREFTSMQDAKLVLVQACSSFCATINPNVGSLVAAKNARDAAYTRYQQNSQSQGALNDYKCADVVFRFMERVARGG